MQSASSLHFMSSDKRETFYDAVRGTSRSSGTSGTSGAWRVGEMFQNICDWHAANERRQERAKLKHYFYRFWCGRWRRSERSKRKWMKKNDNASFAFADKNNGTKDIFISIILIMTPESKQRRNTPTPTSSPRRQPEAWDAVVLHQQQPQSSPSPHTIKQKCW